MSRIRSKDTKPEMIVRRFLYHHGFRYRLHVKELPGKPDIVLHKYKTVIFVHGCFWHGHQGCKISHIPRSNTDYWDAKLSRNCDRDSENISSLEKQGYKVIVIFECNLADKVASQTLSAMHETIIKTGMMKFR